MLSSVLATILVAVSMVQAVTLASVVPWGSSTSAILHLLVEGTALVSGPLVLTLAWASRPRTSATGAAGLLAASAPLVWTSLALSLNADRVQDALGASPWGSLVLASAWLGWAAPWIGIHAALRLSSVYPDGRGEHGVRQVSATSGLLGAVGSLGFRPRRLVAVAVLGPAAVAGGTVLLVTLGAALGWERGEDALLAVALLLAFTWILLVVAAAVRSFLLGFELAPARGRHRALWSAAGLVGAGAAVLLSVVLWILDVLDVVPEFPNEWLLAPVLVAPLLVVCALYLAVFYEGTLDPRLVIRGSAVTAVLTAGLGGLFALADIAVSEVLVNLWPVPDGAAVWAAGAMAALAVGPLHARVNARVDRWMGERLPVTDLATGPRHPLTIVFADMVGYTALAADDEEAALTLASVFHRAARKAADEAGGRLVKSMGDGVLLSFSSPDGAVRASRAMAAALHDACGLLDLPDTGVRFGVHFGEAAVDASGGLFGEAVNLASRLERIAAPGQIVLSGAAADRLVGVELEDLGGRSLKNIRGSVRCWAVRT